MPYSQNSREIEIFPRWSKAWRQKDPSIQDLLIIVQLAVRERYCANLDDPEVDLRTYASSLKRFIKATEKLIGASEFRASARTDAIVSARAIAPLVRVGLWTRWLEMERALLKCLAEDDLICSALLLRVLLEEVSRGRTLSLDCEKLEGGHAWDYSRQDLEVLFRRFWAFGLPRIQPRTQDELKAGAPNDLLGELETDISATIDQLNDFVHPNYGSHRILLSPDQPTIGQVLLRAILKIYTEFNTRPWLVTPSAHDSVTPHFRPTTKSFESEILPAILALADQLPSGDRIPLEELRDHLVRTKEWNGKLTEFGEELFEVGDLDCEPLLHLAKSIGLEINCNADLLSGNFDWPSPLSTISQRLDWLLANRDSKQLEADLTTDTGNPIQLVSALGFFSKIAELKLKWSSLRAVQLMESGFELAATVCSRSVLEHHAVSAWLSEKTQHQVDSFIRRESAQELVTLEKQIARCLSGTKSTLEADTGWRVIWSNLFPNQSVNLLEVVKSGGSEAESHYYYLSGVVHGFAVTGGDLLGPGSVSVRRQLQLRSASALGNCCGSSAVMCRHSFVAYEKLIWLKDKDTKFSPSDAAKQMQAPGKLKFGRDVRGRGTAEDPYRFRDGLMYHESYYDFVQQENLSGERSAWVSDLGMGDQLVCDDGKTLYFLNTSLRLYGL